MTICPSFENRPGKLIPYPGLEQSKLDTCVFASIAGAVNYVTSKQSCTEQSLINAFQAAGESSVTFGVVGKYVPDSLVTTHEYHDRDTPLPSYNIILNALQSGAVVILSLEYANISNGNVVRQTNSHMLSVFRTTNGALQVWDTGKRNGFFTDEEFKELVVGDVLAFPYCGTHLVSHDAHHLFIVQQPCSAD